MGHCTVFSLKTAKLILWKNPFTEICQGWMKKDKKKLFSNEYCDLLVHASFTIFTGPAKLFSNNIISYLKIKIYWQFYDFLWWWSVQRGQLNKSPCRCKKKLTNSIILDLLSCPLIPIIFIKRYTRSIFFVMFCRKLSNSWIYLWTNFLEVHWRCLQNILLQNLKKKTFLISLKYVLVSFPLTPYIFLKRYIFSINFKTIHW